MTLVMLATGTGCSGPDWAAYPTIGMATADCPVVGHGKGGSLEGTRCECGRVTRTAATGVAPGPPAMPPQARNSTNPATTTAVRRSRRLRRLRAARSASTQPLREAWRCRPGDLPRSADSFVERGPDSATPPVELGPSLPLNAIELLGGHEDRPGLGAFGGADDPTSLEQVHQATGPREPNPQLALEHRGRAQLRADDQLHRRDQQLVVVIVP